MKWGKYLFILSCFVCFSSLETPKQEKITFLSFLVPFLAYAEAAESSILLKKRNQMVKEQIIARGIKHKKVLEALRTVKRHCFVPEKYRNEAYEDYPLSIGFEQTISQPYIVALMTELLDLQENDKVLEIGTGSGYEAAILSQICKNVYTIELIEPLGIKAQNTLKEQSCINIKTKIGDGYQGWLEYAPYNAIIVSCAPSHIPESLKEQLAEGGTMIIPLGERFIQELVLLTKKKGEIVQKNILSVQFVPMKNKDGKKY